MAVQMIRDPEARGRVEAMLRASLQPFGLDDDASVRDLARRAPDSLTQDQIDAASKFYTDHKDWRHEIATMPSGYLHNAHAKLKREPWGALSAFTILAMGAEIEKRQAERTP